MKKYIVIYRAPFTAEERMSSVKPDDMGKSMEPWMAWMKKAGSGIVDMGLPLGNGKKVTKSGATPSDSRVVGYSILQAENMDGAVELLKIHPHLDLAAECEIEVYEMLPLPGM